LLRPPKVYSTAHFRLSDNVENLILQGNADLQGYGNGLSNALYGNSGNNPDGFRSSNPTTPASQSVSVGRSRFVRPVACDARVRSHLFVRRAQRLRSKQTLNFLDSILCTRPSRQDRDRRTNTLNSNVRS
jgi:hypothetical protein